MKQLFFKFQKITSRESLLYVSIIKESTPYPSEKHIFISDQDIELWVSPMYCNNPDSTWFQKDESENAAFALFSKENNRQKEKLGLLQQFLMIYEYTKSKFYQQGIEEYEKRRVRDILQ